MEGEGKRSKWVKTWFKDEFQDTSARNLLLLPHTLLNMCVYD